MRKGLLIFIPEELVVDKQVRPKPAGAKHKGVESNIVVRFLAGFVPII